MSGYGLIGAGNDFALTAVKYELRIVSVNVYSAQTSGSFISVNRVENGVPTGGTSIPPLPLRAGSPPCSATAAVSTTAFSGTSRLVNYFYLGPGASQASQEEYYYWVYSGADGQFQSPLAFTIQPGSSLHVLGVTTSMACNVTFEELRLAGCY